MHDVLGGTARARGRRWRISPPAPFAPPPLKTEEDTVVATTS